MKKTKSMVMGAAILAALTLPMVAGAANKLVVNGTDGSTPKMVVTDEGSIGIGTSYPISPLHIAAIGTSASATDMSKAAFNFSYTAYGSNPPVYMSPNFSLYRNNESTTNSGRPRVGDALGSFGFGSVLSGSFSTKALIYGKAESTWATDTNTPTYIQILTNPGGGLANREIIRLSSNTERPVATVNGGLRLYPYTGTGGATPLGTGSNTPAKPLCDSNTQGTLWFTKAAGADLLEICADGASGGIKWRALTIAP